MLEIEILMKSLEEHLKLFGRRARYTWKMIKGHTVLENWFW